jgi:hypothetical protein
MILSRLRLFRDAGDGREGRAVEDEPRPPRRFSLLGIVIVALVLVLGGLLLLPMFAAFEHTSFRAICKNNLKEIHRGMALYDASYGKNKLYPPHLGRAFLDCLRGGDCGGQHPQPWSQRAPLAQLHDLFVCPKTGNAAGPTACDYKGPGGQGLKTPFLTDDVPPDRIIAADKDKSNHHGDGGNAVRFDGSVQYYPVEQYDAIDTLE